MARVTGGGPEEMKRLAARMRTADRVLLKNLRRQMRDLADPLVGAAREAIEASPSKHDGTLRGEVAKTVSASVSVTGSRVTLAVVSRGSRMPAGKGDLAAYLNGRGWRHPVYGRRSVFQASRATGWFSETIAGRAPDLRRAVEAAMDETARQLEG
jgi:hypothetical protein